MAQPQQRSLSLSLALSLSPSQTKCFRDGQHTCVWFASSARHRGMKHERRGFDCVGHFFPRHHHHRPPYVGRAGGSIGIAFTCIQQQVWYQTQTHVHIGIDAIDSCHPTNKKLHPLIKSNCVEEQSSHELFPRRAHDETSRCGQFDPTGRDKKIVDASQRAHKGVPEQNSTSFCSSLRRYFDYTDVARTGSVPNGSRPSQRHNTQHRSPHTLFDEHTRGTAFPNDSSYANQQRS